MPSPRVPKLEHETRKRHRGPKSGNPKLTDIHVGQRIRMRRIVLGISQSALAEKIGVTRQQVQKYEKGVNQVGGNRLQQIAGTLRVPLDYFFQ